MGVSVAFDYGAWIFRYPEFSSAVQSAAFEASIANTVLTATFPLDSGSLARGSIISGVGVLPGTYVTKQETTPGVFDLNYAQTISLESMTAVMPDVGPDLAQAFFNEATIYWRNDGSGLVDDPVLQTQLLNMLTAHFAARYATTNGNAPSGLVGRISQAGQGPVSLSTEFNVPPGTAAWYLTTNYGSDFYVATQAYRTAHYRPGRRRIMNPWFQIPGIMR